MKYKAVMSNMIEATIMKGAMKTDLTVHNMIFGYESQIAREINGGDFLWGDYHYLDKEVTPVFNDQNGAIKDQEISLFTGNVYPAKTGIVKW